MTNNPGSVPDFSNTQIAFAAQSTPRLYESYMVFKALGSNALVKLGTTAITSALKLHLPVTPLIRHTVFKQFCGGTSLEDCLPVIDHMAKFGVKSIPDYSVEACTKESELDDVAEEIKRTISFTKIQDGVAMSVFKVTGVIRFDILEKVSKKEALNTEDQKAFQNGRARVRALCSDAHKQGIVILIDAEESWIQDAIDELAWEMMLEFNKNACIVYNTLQMYRWDRLAYLKKMSAQSKEAGIRYGAKLVRGAYMEKERDRASQLNYRSPIQADKAATDRDFDAAVTYCLEHQDSTGLFIGTHNEASTLKAVAIMREKNIPTTHKDVCFSQLFGMSDNLSFNLAKHKFNVAKYLPYGPVKSVLPYLFRRAAENTSIKGQAGRELTLIEKELKRRKEN